MGECCFDRAKVAGSNPASPTIKKGDLMNEYSITFEGEMETRIQLIKAFRISFNSRDVNGDMVTTMSLRESIDAINSMLNGIPVNRKLTGSQWERLVSSGFKLHKITGSETFHTNARNHVRVSHPSARVQKIQTIKAFRNVTHNGLLEAKQQVDKMCIDGYSNLFFIDAKEYRAFIAAGFVVEGWIEDHFDKGLFEI